MLLAAYFSTMDDLGVETWLAHNSLLGWRKTGKVLPSCDQAKAKETQIIQVYIAFTFNRQTRCAPVSTIPRVSCELLQHERPQIRTPEALPYRHPPESS